MTEHDQTGGGGAPGGGRRIAVALLLVVLLAAAALCGWNWHRTAELQHSRDEALVAAKKDAVRIASYDYRSLDAYFEALRKLSTGDLAKQYRSASKDLRPVLIETKATAKATVLEAGIVSATRSRVRVVLFVDQQVTNTLSAKPQTDRNRMSMTLSKSEGRWRVSKLELK